MSFARAAFFSGIRRSLHKGSLSTQQVDNYLTILGDCEKYPLPAPATAYVLATVYHETARTITPLKEYGRGKGRTYGKPAGPYNQIYYGRGFVQLTWLSNYEKQTKKFGVNFVKFPDRVMEPEFASKILVGGMVYGDFTGKKLSDYFGKGKKDYEGARRIINGTDKKREIASIARKFEAALTQRKEETSSGRWGAGAGAAGTAGTAVVVSQNPEYWPVVLGVVLIAAVIGFVVWKKKKK